MLNRKINEGRKFYNQYEDYCNKTYEEGSIPFVYEIWLENEAERLQKEIHVLQKELTAWKGYWRHDALENLRLHDEIEKLKALRVADQAQLQDEENENDILKEENEKLKSILKEIKNIIPRGGSKHGKSDYVTMITYDKVKFIHDIIDEAIKN